ncbi:hypothetical protein TNCV_203681 [Trichonephila clavipes]|nr:hypothetical protein TNCV_203681 [Trichonephila clavipes]
MVPKVSVELKIFSQEAMKANKRVDWTRRKMLRESGLSPMLKVQDSWVVQSLHLESESLPKMSGDVFYKKKTNREKAQKGAPHLLMTGD